MTADIDGLLRKRAAQIDPDLLGNSDARLMTTAADELARLRRERDELRKALNDITWLRPVGPTRNNLVERMERIAINALEGYALTERKKGDG